MMNQITDNRNQITKIAAILSAVICSLLFVRLASAATLFSAAANQDTYEGQTFVVDWYLDTEDKPINVLDLALNFSKDTLEVSEINAGNSLLNLWIKNPSADNQNGSIRLTGGITGGIKSSKVPLFRTVFRAKAPGNAFITLDSASQVLLNDGRGSATDLKFRNVAFIVYPKNFIPTKISSRTHPAQDTWYKDRDVAISFEKKPGTQYSYSFSSNIELIPDNQAQDAPGELVYPNRPDGIYYFKLNSKSGADNWQEAGVFRVQVDATAPEEFLPVIGSDPGIYTGKKFVSFSTVDKMSGISHYNIKLGAFNIRDSAASPYILPKFVIGKIITVTAVDYAGNQRTENINYDEGFPLGLFYLIFVAITLALLALIRFARNKIKK